MKVYQVLVAFIELLEKKTEFVSRQGGFTFK